MKKRDETRGRKVSKNPKSYVLQLRFTKAEKRKIEQWAKEENKTMADLIRLRMFGYATGMKPRE